MNAQSAGRNAQRNEHNRDSADHAIHHAIGLKHAAMKTDLVAIYRIAIQLDKHTTHTM